MTPKARGGLGRGLAALIPTGPTTTTVADVLIGGGPPVKREAPPLSLVTSPVDETDESAPGRTPARSATPDVAPDVAATDAASDAAAADAATAHAASDAAIEAAATTAGDASVGAPDSADPAGPRYLEIPVSQIRRNPRNPRTVFDEDAMVELAHSIREFGLLQPIVVRDVPGDGYELVMGERRWQAAQRAGLTTIAAIVRRTQDAEMLRDALLENIHRANLNPLEEAAAYQQLLEEFDVTQEELAARIGRSRPVISNTIRLLKLPIPVQRRVAAGVLSAGHARALLSLTDPEDQEQLAARIVAEGLSVRGTEEAVTLSRGRSTPRRRATPPKRTIPGLENLAGALSDAFDTRVRLELGRTKGRIVVEFATQEDLRRLIAVMAPSAIDAAGRQAAG
jgi:ParB family chromosome partitioning protein